MKTWTKLLRWRTARFKEKTKNHLATILFPQLNAGKTSWYSPKNTKAFGCCAIYFNVLNKETHYILKPVH